MIRTLKNSVGAISNKLFSSRENAIASRLQRSYRLPDGKGRVYHYHIRKTAGTSLNLAFFSEYGAEEAKHVHQQISKRRFNLRAINRNEVFVGWETNLLSTGHYFYGFSHSPLHELRVSEGSFTITIFRDPVKRVASHFNMLRHYLITVRFRLFYATKESG